MPTYDYHCPTNGRTLEVMHPMSAAIHTWGEACERAGIDPGDTPATAPVTRAVTAGIPLTTGASHGGQFGPGCQAAAAPRMGGCCGGMCHGHG